MGAVTLFLVVPPLTAFFLWCFYYFWTNRRLLRLSLKVQGPLYIPLLGSMHIFLCHHTVIGKRLAGLFEQYPGLAKMWVVTELNYLVSEPDLIEAVLNNPVAYGKGDVYERAGDILGHGILTAPAMLWKKKRRIFSPCFNQQVLNRFPEVMARQSQVLVQELLGAKESRLNFKKYITKCVLDINCETIFGLALNCQGTDMFEPNAFDRFMEILSVRALNFIYFNDFIFKNSELGREFDKISLILNNLSEKIIVKNEQYYETHKDDINDACNEKKIITQLLTQRYKQKEISRKELLQEINAFLLAGTDTTSIAITSVLTMIAIYPDVQQRIYEEIIEAVGSERILQLEDVSKLQYTERVIKESLRLLPSVPFIARSIEKDLYLGKTLVPQGSNAIISIFSVHRNAKLWPEPLKFDPDRFLPERSQGRHPYAWLSFAGGPRNCIGLKMAMMMMKIMIATVIRKMKLKSVFKNVEDIDLSIDIMLKPKDQYNISYELR